ncbi:MAG: cobyric acid synthase CobQ [Hydrococcus sp. C42_A2020_068]|uniref:cobyric acid synthase CobQ n=1 Tax=Pleurocapsa sp. PCC 7327 TaxID=118163 RepID=UPI00029FF48C|nr:cobyric acid synthase CobQ [Pleurocapsa sp. PCC 7327]AFY79545.1 cobyric acid synthase CobQ [Pleurocapsa sp. PCC 7327]MBF2021120.1 cobyric acid synthase CobQ [Hydrococcus sp. C42_A2020_068]
MKAIMVVGTTSHAGKSFLTAALCRILSRRGWHVAPFKGQNMALNAYVTPTGGEIGYAQAVQAWAAGTTPRVEMNPILLKPQGNMTSQVIMMGKAAGKTTAAEYYENYFERGWEAITSALAKLSAEYDLLICEGAGSPAEINLKHRDLTNMRVAKHLNAPTLLVVDIDRGGAFAHVVGTLELLEPEERALIKGIVINKFRGIKSLLDPGISWLEKRTQIPVIGVIPWREAMFPAEDSLDLLERRSYKQNSEVKIAIVRLPRISNFTDFDPLDAEPTVSIKYVNLQEPLGHPDAVIIPGSKTTITDLMALCESGMADKIRDYADAGGIVLGICGGFQMLGQSVFDPERVESDEDEYPGLNLLPVETIISRDKTARQRQAVSNYPQSGLPIVGYEIHQGMTRIVEPAKKSTKPSYYPLFNDSNLGMVNESQSIWGCYLHGLFDNGPWRRAWLNYLRQRRGLYSLPTGIANYREQREAILDAIADLVDEHLNLTPLMSER